MFRNIRISDVALLMAMVFASTHGGECAGGDDHTVMLIMAPRGPVFAEFSISVDGQAYKKWVTALLAKKVDVNNDDQLTVDELQLIPDRLIQQARAGDASRMLRESTGDRTAAHVDADTFHLWFSKQLDRGFNVVAGAVQASEAVRLAGHLDSNDDGRVSRREIEEAPYTMRFRDLDNDQTFTASELMPFRDPRTQQAAVVPDAADLPFVQLTDEAACRRASVKLIARYGIDGRVAVDVLRLPAEDILRFDDNRDDQLNASELAEMLSDCPTHFRMDVLLSDRANVSALKFSIPETSSSFCQSEPTRRSRARLLLDEMPISVRARGGSRDTRGMMANFVLQRTSLYDEDKNGNLSEEEFPQMQQQLAQIQVNGSFQDVDLNSDGMVTRSEIKTYIERDVIATQSKIEVSVKQDGKTLFKILDSNFDRRLSIRELQHGFDRLVEYDSSNDQQVSEEELGTAYTLEIGLGVAESFRLSNMTSMGMMDNRTDAILPGLAGLDGPEWFKRMDRNQDGDVSGREFLGPRAVFSRLDADSDGLLSAKEAASLEDQAESQP